MAGSDPWRVPWPDRWGAFWMRTWPNLGPWLAALESRSVQATETLPEIKSPVFVCGLARSGSTILLEALAGLPGFASHRYADFPMLWTPYWWGRLLSRLPATHLAPVERAHRDRILVTRLSPEAFEEPLWEHFFPFARRPTDVLDAATSHPEFEDCYRLHIQKLLLARAAERYVAKGNYNTLRMGYLAKLFPDARFLVPIRTPLAHVASLMRQDQLYQSAPGKTLRQIEARGHYEFGPIKRPVRIKPTDSIGAPPQATATYWLQQWLAVYQHAQSMLDAAPERSSQILFVPYESLADHPAAGFAQISRFLGLDPTSKSGLALQEASRRFVGSAHEVPVFGEDLSQNRLLEQALDLFHACARRFFSAESTR